MPCRRRSSALGTTPLPRVSVFMSVFDCHVNRTPVTGRIERSPTRRENSSTPISTRRARTTSATASSIATDVGRVGVVQIAGLIARRIVCWVKEGQAMNAGERIGMIRFGSRVDVYLPAGTVPLVSEGQTSLAGETVIADIGAAPQSRSFRVG